MTPDFWYPCALHAVGHEHAEPVLKFLAEVHQKFGINRILSRGFTVFERSKSALHLIDCEITAEVKVG